MSQNPYRLLPSITTILEFPLITEAQARFPRSRITEAARLELEALRQQIANNVPINGSADLPKVAARVLNRLEAHSAPRFRPVINATGIVLHTNLGRSPMAESAASAAYEAARGYLNLELDLDTGKRSSRQANVREHLQRLTGAESATVVNNCAAATVLVLRVVAAGKEVIVSRGQLIEIGGSFRIPDIMAVSGSTLREVGTTNITRALDYERAIGPQTGAIMRIHTSNYRIRGFTESVGIEELVSVGRQHNIPVIDDIGSGSAIDLTADGLAGEPLVTEGIRAGADLVLFSGDKMLGGPQAGIIAGSAQWIAKIEKDPLMRTFRLDKMTLAALEATLRLYADPASAREQIPTLQMMTLPLDRLRARAERFAQILESENLGRVSLRDDVTYIGGGSLPDVAVPTAVIAFSPTDIRVSQFARRLRLGAPAVVARVQDDAVLFDLRTVFERQESDLLAAIRQSLTQSLGE